MTAGSTSLASGTGSGNRFGITASTTASWTGNAAGSYYFGFYDATASTYAIMFYVYLGGTGAFTPGSVLGASAGVMNDTANDTSGHVIRVYCSTGSAGSVAIGSTTQVFNA
jgi:hypothetical protein